MAAVSVLYPAVTDDTMASRRPLANVPNAVNSPYRTTAATNNAKRTRAQAGDREAFFGQPPAKKQIIEIPDEDEEENIDPRKKDMAFVHAQNKLDEPFARRLTDKQPTAFERKLYQARERKVAPQARQDKPQRAAGDNLETIRQWQRHYKRQFPHFVIYFDGVPDDARSKAVHQIRTLGAREEKFFSKAVTHVVTTRAIPAELITTSPDDEKYDNGAQQKTIQPSLLTQDQRKTTNLLDANLQRRAQSQAPGFGLDVDPRRIQQVPGTDILSRARELGIKIWALEKLHRILKTMLEADTGDQPAAHDTRNHITVNKSVTRPAVKDGDLELLLRNEKLTGHADRDMSTVGQDMVTLRNCYLYIHDMDEKTKPVMVREYSKPTNGVKEQGKWPQFRLTSAGRCPFVEDPAHTKKLQQQEREAAKAQEELAQRRTRGVAADGRTGSSLRPLTQSQVNVRRSPRKVSNEEKSKPLDPPKSVPQKTQMSTESMPPLFGSAQQSLRGQPRMVGGEPVASGMQHSNVTSAIRSQVISSAAISSTAPGANRRIGDSKEISALKRKVLERGNTVTSNQSMPSSYMNDMRAALNNDNEPQPRAAKRKAQETLGVVQEDEEITRDQKRVAVRKPERKRSKPAEREPKPGYCENCRDKYEDFEEHILSRKHRKFAVTQDNWKELDALLCQLKRPHKSA
ncbi:Hypothetical protein R9X50_00139400 [Acrodontium crateriforme]|uniref:DBF4-type domain-containing protein n=1 Tax=Acrodontium crateriforme TaxID=150365 RepID=A0AAQ3LYZ3_9PEZI|nr:Hypothetical protein R9X50_00139400 [Acrodontium crateriforme]